MSVPALKRGDRGPEVRRLQDMMNRTGKLLLLDGTFGPGTERMLRACQAEAGFPPTGVADERFWNWLVAQPEPSDFLSCEAVAFIAREEITSQAHYERHLARPEWPGEESGITIGVGYDLRFHGDSFEADWGERLVPDVLARLRPFVGIKGSKAMADGLSDVHIPYAVAWWVYTRCTMPKYIDMTRAVYPRLDNLPDLCRAALVSLVFNRGGALGSGDRRREMREIAAALDSGDLAAVPALLESMSRLWPNSRGLRERRGREAALWRRGLQTV